jgi:hypothetical protein
MTRNLKVLGLALASMLAMTAIFSSAAMAEFESESGSVDLSVSSNEMQSFKTSSGSENTVECTNVDIHSETLESTSETEVTVEPTYSECEQFLGQNVDIDENGCDYTFHLEHGKVTESSTVHPSDTKSSVDLECTSTSGIEITVGNICRYKISTQTSLGSIEYKNKGTGSTREIELVPSVTGITSTRTTSDFPFLCPGGSSTGTYTGNSVVTGFTSTSTHIGVFVD